MNNNMIQSASDCQRTYSKPLRKINRRIPNITELGRRSTTAIRTLPFSPQTFCAQFCKESKAWSQTKKLMWFTSNIQKKTLQVQVHLRNILRGKNTFFLCNIASNAAVQLPAISCSLYLIFKLNLIICSALRVQELNIVSLFFFSADLAHSISSRCWLP